MDKKSRIISTLCTTIACIGWILIGGGSFWLILFTRAHYNILRLKSDEVQFLLYGISEVSFDTIFVGLGAIIVSRLARLVFEKESKPALMLRCGDKILYLFAVLAILWAVLRHLIFAATTEDSTARFLYGQPELLLTILKAIILILLGQILKRSIPAIEEYKSLV